MSIADKITRLQTAKTNIATAITTKGGTVASGDGFEDFATDIATIPSGGGGGDMNIGVSFYGFDNELKEHWNPEDVASKGELPAFSTHTGFTPVEWNWTLSEIKEAISKYPEAMINVMQVFVTDDGKTRIKINANSNSFVAEINIYGITSPVTVSWGDNTADTVLNANGTASHTYATSGIYDATIYSESGYELGNNSADVKAFNTNLQEHTIEFYGASNVKLGRRTMFYSNNACEIKRVTIPPNFFKISISNITSYFLYCANYLTYISLPKIGVNISNQSIYGLLPLNFMSFSYANTSSSDGGIIYRPSSCMKNLFVKVGHTVQKNVANIDNITFADNSKSAVAANYGGGIVYASLERLTIGKSVTMSPLNLHNAINLKSIRFRSATPITISASDCFTNVPTSCIIYVPRGSLTAYTTATNYPDSNIYSYVEYDVVD